jgi:GNAT superfamily N-acetyltransferase
MTVTIRRIAPDDAAGIVAYARIRCAVTPDDPDSAESAAWEDEAYPGAVHRFLAVDGGAEVGAASTGRIHMHGPEFERYWLGIWVLPEARRRGTGCALYSASSQAARAAGKAGFQTELSEEHEAGHRFLAARGFVETDRVRVVRLDLLGLPAPDPVPPAGIRLTTLAQCPDLVAAVHRAATEVYPDVPTGASPPLSALDLAGFIARDVERPGAPKDAFVVALDEGTGEVAGYASLILLPGTAAVAFHGMTAVRRPWRGRGLATALKRSTIAWAIEHGLEALVTGNDTANATMRAVNAKLGYRPLPDVIGLHGPLAPDATVRGP